MSELRSLGTSLLGVSIILASAMASAARGTPMAIITTTQPVSSPAGSNLYATSNDFHLNVAPFNTALGTLTGASIGMALSAQEILTISPTPIRDGQMTVGYNTNAPYNNILTQGSAMLALNTPDVYFPDLTTIGYYLNPAPPRFAPIYTGIPYTGTTPSTPTSVPIDTINVAMNYTYAVPQDGVSLLTGSSATPVEFAVAISPIGFSQNGVYNGSLGAIPGSVTGTATISFTFIPALPGDVDFDGRISISDYLAIDSGTLRNAPATYANGDFNGDGSLNYQDYAVIDAAYRAQSGGSASGEISLHTAEFGSAYVSALNGLSAAPEPASLTVLGLGLLGLRFRRKR